ncbi:MAG: hypothetical protein ACXACG_08620 [Candidatus Thorarchaeota archaeon]|jgi:hypothetical protein
MSLTDDDHTLLRCMFNNKIIGRKSRTPKTIAKMCLGNENTQGFKKQLRRLANLEYLTEIGGKKRRYSLSRKGVKEVLYPMMAHILV